MTLRWRPWPVAPTARRSDTGQARSQFQRAEPAPLGPGYPNRTCPQQDSGTLSLQADPVNRSHTPTTSGTILLGFKAARGGSMLPVERTGACSDQDPARFGLPLSNSPGSHLPTSRQKPWPHQSGLRPCPRVPDYNSQRAARGIRPAEVAPAQAATKPRLPEVFPRVGLSEVDACRRRKPRPAPEARAW